MRILIEGENLEGYLAKCHEALRTGLRAQFDARCFGKGYDKYNMFTKSIQKVLSRTFPDAPPDLILIYSWFPNDIKRGLLFQDLADVPIPKAITLGDYWSEAESQFDAYTEFILCNRIDFILSYFPQPLSLWQNTQIGKRLIYMPPTFDPSIFNDWGIPKTYDVGFLAAGTVDKSDFYPERQFIHQEILKRKDLRYLWAAHPGWQRRNRPHPLVGKNFSKAINSCKIFITTGGINRNPQPKIFEALASKTLLMSDEPQSAEMLGLQDGITYVKISKSTVLDKIDYYLSHPEEAERISEAGYQLSMRRHSCYARAMEFYEAIQPRLVNRAHSDR